MTAALLASLLAAATTWHPAPDTLMTRWAADVSPECPWPEYPRPQMVRPEWQNLNGLWDYAIRPAEAKSPGKFDGHILVPFAVESALSGVQKPVQPNEALWYRRTFDVPAAWKGKRVMLNFEAVDWDATVWVNGTEAGRHKGGYDPFSFDITGMLKPDGPQEVFLKVLDATNQSTQSRGKQVLEPQGIMYTAVTGIWQTVWIEAVPEGGITKLRMETDIEAGTLALTVESSGGTRVEAAALESGAAVATAKGKPGEPLIIKLDEPKLWSPESPQLYDLEVKVTRGGKTLDTVASYFGMREIAVKKDAGGVNRLFLNGEPLFQFGPLDQGWWPDGLYTAPTDAALAFDVEATRQMGFNMARKHVKVEPRRWYYHCDRLGLMVWQDMPSGDGGVAPGAPEDFKRSPESAAQFEREAAAHIKNLYNHPSIVMWVPFNEGWGQYDTNRITEWVKQLDPARLVNQASGWQDRNGGDVHDMHRYPGPGMPEPEADRAVVLGEFGGLGLPVEGHLWWNKRNWGYRNLEGIQGLRDNYANLIRALRPLIGRGLSAAVYTQTTDVEGEVNGLLTYDRDMNKMGAAWLAAVNAQVHRPAPKVTVVLPTSENEGRPWRYTTKKPKDGWMQPDFADGKWREGIGVFGTKGTPGAAVRTTWDTPDIWLRRTVTLDAANLDGLTISLLHDEDAEVYFNGVLAASTVDFTGAYILIDPSPQAREALKPGENLIAIHCTQTVGGQSIDLGLVALEEQQ